MGGCGVLSCTRVTSVETSSVGELGERRLSCGSLRRHQVLMEPGHSFTSPESWTPRNWQSPLNRAPTACSHSSGEHDLCICSLLVQHWEFDSTSSHSSAQLGLINFATCWTFLCKPLFLANNSTFGQKNQTFHSLHHSGMVCAEDKAFELGHCPKLSKWQKQAKFEFFHKVFCS